MLVIFSKLSYLNELTIIMQIFTIVITTFIFGGPSNLSQESTTQVNSIATRQQDKL